MQVRPEMISPAIAVSFGFFEMPIREMIAPTGAKMPKLDTAMEPPAIPKNPTAETMEIASPTRPYMFI